MDPSLSVEREQRVTPLELFFDLVFVFAFTQVTAVLSGNPTWSGLAHGLLILTALWWAWAAYSRPSVTSSTRSRRSPSAAAPRSTCSRTWRCACAWHARSAAAAC